MKRMNLFCQVIRNGKKVLSFCLFAFLPLNMAAQDDMYFVPSKANVAKEAEEYGMPKNTYYSGSQRTIDDYNRRAWSQVTPIDSTGNDVIDFSAVKGVYPDSTYSELAQEKDYQYTKRLTRFEGYALSDAYWDGYRDGRWSSPWYYNSWYSWYDYDPWYWGRPYYYSWYSPWHYGWYDPWYYGRYGWYGGYGWYTGPWYGGRTYVSRPATRRTTYNSGRSFGQRPGSRTTTQNRSFGSRSQSTNFGSSGSSFGGGRSSGGGSFSGGGGGGGRSTSGGRSYGGRR